MVQVHKIRQISTGYYSTGGSTPSFTKMGKMWLTTASLNLHLAQFKPAGLRKAYKDCQLVTYELTELLATDMNDMARRAERKETLYEMHRSTSFSNFMSMLDDKELTEDYRWVIYLESNYSNREARRVEGLNNIKHLEIKKQAYRTSECTFAFRNREDAAKFRLMATGMSHSYDAVSLMDFE